MASTLWRTGIRSPLRSLGEPRSGSLGNWGTVGERRLLESWRCKLSNRAFSTEELTDAESNGGEKASNGRLSSDQGVFKAVLLGEVTQPPTETVLRSGKSITNLFVATGGMRVARKTPESPSQRPVKQIHKVVVYQDRFRELVMQKIKKGCQVYLEGNMESRVFNDPVTGAVKVVREIAVRQNGRLFLMEELELRGLSKSNAKGKQSMDLGEDHDAEELVVRS